MAFGVEQGEFVDFLRCRQQIAFHARSKQRQRFAVDIQIARVQAAAYPGGQLGGADGLGFVNRAVFGKRGEPFALLLAAFELGHHDKGKGVRRRVLRQLQQHVTAVFAGLAVGNVNFQQLQIGKQPAAGGGAENVFPVELRIFAAVALAVEIALFAGGGTQGVERFDAQQVFFAVQQVKRLQRGVQAA